IAWLPLTSTIVAFARLAIARWAATGIIWSSVTTRDQLGLVLHAGSLKEITVLRRQNRRYGAPGGGSLISEATDVDQRRHLRMGTSPVITIAALSQNLVDASPASTVLAIFLLLRCQPSARGGQSHDNSRRVSHRSQSGAVRREQSASTSSGVIRLANMTADA